MLFTHNLFKFIYKDLLYCCYRSSGFGTFLIVSIQIFGISRLPFHTHPIFKILWFSFTSMLKWESMPFQMPQSRTFSPVCHSNHAVSSVVCSILHGHPFSYLYYFSFALSSLPCLLCSISCWCSTHALAIFTFLFVFAKPTSVSWYQPQTVVPKYSILPLSPLLYLPLLRL